MAAPPQIGSEDLHPPSHLGAISCSAPQISCCVPALPHKFPPPAPAQSRLCPSASILNSGQERARPGMGTCWHHLNVKGQPGGLRGTFPSHSLELRACGRNDPWTPERARRESKSPSYSFGKALGNGAVLKPQAGICSQLLGIHRQTAIDPGINQDPSRSQPRDISMEKPNSSGNDPH